MTEERFGVGPAIERATTLPAEFYRSRGVFDELTERVLAPSWQWIGRESDVREAGGVRPFELLPGSLNEPLLLARDAGGALRCLSNVCTHRGNLVRHVAGPCRQLLCRYHGRRFALDGTLQHAPEFEGVEGFPSQADNLPSLRLESEGGFLFTSLAPETDWGTLLGSREPGSDAPFERDLFGLLSAQLQHDPSRDRDFLVDAHWVLYMENYLEGFHVPYVHPGLAKALDIGAYRTFLYDRSNVQLGVARPGEPVFEGTEHAAYYLWLFPNTMLNFYPWGVSVNVVEPLGMDRTRVRFRTFVGNAEFLGRGAGGDLDQVEFEDERVVEAEQRGIRSRLYRRGRYSTSCERGVHQFHRLLQKALG